MSTEKSKSRQKKKIMSWDPFFDDDDIVKSIKKASNRLRPGGTSCMMPKYVDAIEGRLEFCSTSSVIGLCNRKGNDATSCRALWKKHVSSEEQETFVSKLHTLTTSELEEFQHKFGEAMMLRVREEYEEEKHRDTLHYNHGSNELRESFEKSRIDRANEIAESTPTKEDERSRPPLDSTTRSAFAHLTKDDLITMYIESKLEYDKFIKARGLDNKKIGTPYTPSKYQQTKEEGICEDFSKGDTCAFSYEENGCEEMKARISEQHEIQKKFKFTEKESESENVDNEALKKFKENDVMQEHLTEIYEEVWEWQQLCFGGIAERKYAEEEAMPRIRDSLIWVERRLGMDLGAARPRAEFMLG